MLKTSVNIEVIYAELPWAERFAAAKNDGFDYIEFWNWDDKNLPEVKRLLDKNSLKISGMSGDGPFSMSDPVNKKDYIEFIEKSIEAAKIIDCPTLIIHSDSLEDEPQYAKPLAGDYSFTTKICAMFDVLKTIAPMAEAAGITFALEALNTYKDHKRNFLDNTKMSVDLIRAVNSPNVKILYDAYHMYLVEGKIAETVEESLDAINYIHIADAPGRHEPGTGTINYRAFMKHLAKIGYKNVIGFELYPKSGTEAAVKAIKEVSEGI